MTSDSQRRERVKQGSRRQRDLAVAGDAADRSRENFLKALRWAKRACPEQHAPFAASAAMTIKSRGGKPTAENVRARLKEQGRDIDSLEGE